jgi:hypothetical protein
MADVSAILDLADRTREADMPHSPVVRFSASTPVLISRRGRSPIRPTARSMPTAAMQFWFAMR